MMEGFTLALALADGIPVVCFGISMILLALRFQSALFVLGACISTAAGCGKVLWKLLLGTVGKNVSWLNRYFVPTQMFGFVCILVSLALGFRRIEWAAMIRFPAVLFYGIWAAGMGIMSWYRKNRFDNSARANWTAEIINSIAQGALLLGLLV